MREIKTDFLLALCQKDHVWNGKDSVNEKFLWSCEERHDICCAFSGRKGKLRRQEEKRKETSDRAEQRRYKLTLAFAQDTTG